MLKHDDFIHAKDTHPYQAYRAIKKFQKKAFTIKIKMSIFMLRAPYVYTSPYMILIIDDLMNLRETFVVIQEEGERGTDSYPHIARLPSRFYD